MDGENACVSEHEAVLGIHEKAKECCAVRGLGLNPLVP